MSLSKLSREQTTYAAAAVAAVAIAGYGVYRACQSSKTKDQSSANQDKTVENKHESDVGKLGDTYFYDSPEAMRYCNRINRGSGYTGLGIYEKEVEEVCPISGRKYRRGCPKDDLEPFHARNQQMWDWVQENIPKDRKIRAIELGSGRGALSRYLAIKLEEAGVLEHMISTNLSDKENEWNMEQARKEGVPMDKYEVLNVNFDNLSQFKDGSFDLIFSNEALNHSSDHAKVGREMGRLLKKGGVTVFTDLCTPMTADPVEADKMYKKLKIKCFPTIGLYDEALQSVGMKKIHYHGDAGVSIVRHWGMQLYDSTVYKRDFFLGPGGISKEFLQGKIDAVHGWLDYGENNLLEQVQLIYKKE